MLLLISTNAIAQDSNIEMSLNYPTYGIKIKNNFPGSTSGFARAFMLSNEDGNTNYFGLGVFGSVINGVSNFGYGYLGTAYNNSYMTFLQGGNIGIGTNSPAERLEVNGRIKAGDRIYANSADVNTLSLIQSYNSAGGPSVLRSYSGTSYWDFAASQSAGGNTLFIGQGIDVSTNNAAIAIASNNNVGIGTNDPKGYKLAVNGKIRTQEIKVENTNWPDYVFAKDYKLPTLQQTEQHIKEKGHLLGIPSAAEVKTNGIDLGEMNAKLLQKIEELTLHLIEMKKQLNEHNKTIWEQEERWRKLGIK